MKALHDIPTGNERLDWARAFDAFSGRFQSTADPRRGLWTYDFARRADDTFFYEWDEPTIRQNERVDTRRLLIDLRRQAELLRHLVRPLDHIALTVTRNQYYALMQDREFQMMIEGQLRARQMLFGLPLAVIDI